GEGAIFMNENATIVNNSGEDITVWVGSGDDKKEVIVKNGDRYNPSQKNPGGSSSSGCNAGFGIAMLLSAAAAMLCKRKRG
ncbi:MAG: Synerg-CTERM sorting domain-containing protein, partial [Synergistes sp.]|nr:Synerg-CTERM sorting domain-containing protein [Synergistes sp.]